MIAYVKDSSWLENSARRDLNRFSCNLSCLGNSVTVLIFFLRRLFLDYHGLKLLYKWMSVLTDFSVDDLDLKLIIEDALDSLTFPHKTMLKESGVLPTISRWADPSKQAPEMVQPVHVPAVQSAESSRATTPELSAQSTPLKSAIR